MDQVLTCYGKLSANGPIIKIKFYLAFVAPAEQIHLPSEIDFAVWLAPHHSADLVNDVCSHSAPIDLIHLSHLKRNEMI